MHIAFFTSSLPEPNRKPGGVDVHVERLAQRLAARGHRLDLYTFSPPVGDRAYNHIQLWPVGLRYSKVARSTLLPLLLNRLRPTADVLHLHGDDWFYVHRTLPTVRTFYGSALMEAIHATRLRRRVYCSTVFLLEILASRLATASYDIAPGQGRIYRTIGTLPPAVEPPYAALPRATRPTILFIGTWEGRKRGRMLAEIFSREVLPRIPAARLVMVSDHVEPAAGIEHVPRPSNKQLAALLSEAWVMCLPSSYEGFGIPYAEAMAAGTPVVATPNVGSRYVLDDGRAGVICSEQELGTVLIQVLTDEPLRAALARRGAERVSEFAWERVLCSHEAAYEKALTVGTPPPRPRSFPTVWTIKERGRR